MTAKEARQMVAEYERHGYTAIEADHWKIYDGPRLVTTLSKSKCRGRADQNARMALKRAIRARRAATA